VNCIQDLQAIVQLDHKDKVWDGSTRRWAMVRFATFCDALSDCDFINANLDNPRVKPSCVEESIALATSCQTWEALLWSAKIGQLGYARTLRGSSQP